MNRCRIFGALRALTLGILSCCVSACDPHGGRAAEEKALAALPRRDTPKVTLSSVLEQSPFAVVHSELSPLILLRSESRSLTLFAPESSESVVSPRYLAYGLNGPKILTNAASVVLTNLQERWLLAWYNGAKGWEAQDCPIGIQLQAPAKRVTLSREGLKIEFDGPAGVVGLQALYGAFPLPTSTSEAASRGIPRDEYKRMAKTWEWSAAVPREPLTRLRYWGSTLARFPYGAWTLPQRDVPSAGVWTIHAQFDWLEIPFQWDTPHVTQAPISLELGRVALRNPDQFQFSSTLFDMQIEMPGGPLCAVSDAESYALTVQGGSERVAELQKAGISLNNISSGAAWTEWPFQSGQVKPGALTVSQSAGGPRLYWNAQTKTALARVDLGAIRIPDSLATAPDVITVNSNTVVTRWRPEKR